MFVAVQGGCRVEQVLGKCVGLQIEERCSHLMICAKRRIHCRDSGRPSGGARLQRRPPNARVPAETTAKQIIGYGVEEQMPRRWLRRHG